MTSGILIRVTSNRTTVKLAARRVLILNFFSMVKIPYFFEFE